MEPMAGASTTARARVRAELIEEIKAAARRQLAEVGAAELSLRAVARDVGMVSSAVYRYVASRDELLTALVVDAYDAVGAAAEAAAAGRGGFEARWLRLARAVRDWARANPHEYALVYGSPVPGYRAPDVTIAPAARPAAAALGLVAAAVAAGEVDPGRTVPLPRSLHGDLARLRDQLAPGVPDEVLARTVWAWTQMFGLISFELFGHLTNVVSDHDEHFTHQVRRSAHLVLHGP